MLCQFAGSSKSSEVKASVVTGTTPACGHERSGSGGGGVGDLHHGFADVGAGEEAVEGVDGVLQPVENVLTVDEPAFGLPLLQVGEGLGESVPTG